MKLEIIRIVMERCKTISHIIEKAIGKKRLTLKYHKLYLTCKGLTIKPTKQYFMIIWRIWSRNSCRCRLDSKNFTDYLPFVLIVWILWDSYGEKPGLGLEFLLEMPPPSGCMGAMPSNKNQMKMWLFFPCSSLMHDFSFEIATNWHVRQVKMLDKLQNLDILTFVGSTIYNCTHSNISFDEYVWGWTLDYYYTKSMINRMCNKCYP